MAKKAKKAAKKTAPKRVARANRAVGQLMASTGGGWGPKEQALSWALQIPRGAADASQIVADAKLFEAYLGGVGRSK